MHALEEMSSDVARVMGSHGVTLLFEKQVGIAWKEKGSGACYLIFGYLGMF